MTMGEQENQPRKESEPIKGTTRQQTPDELLDVQRPQEWTRRQRRGHEKRRLRTTEPEGLENRDKGVEFLNWCQTDPKRIDTVLDL